MISLHEGRRRLRLDGPWRYALENEDLAEGCWRVDFDASSWREMDLPKNWYRTEVGDFFGAIWFRREFRVPDDLREERLFLRFGAVDYIADVWLNGAFLGRHEGMFDPFEFDLTDLIDLDGTNVVVVRDDAPRDPTEYVEAASLDGPLSPPYRTHQGVAISQVKGHMIDAMHRPGAMTSFRSDGNTGGIWDSVELIARPDVYVDLVTIATRIVKKKDPATGIDRPDGSALVSLDVAVCNTTRGAIETEISLQIDDDRDHHEHARPVVLPPGRSLHKVVTTVTDPQLWWTWDRGDPHLYTAAIAVAGDTVRQRFGIKELEHDDATGQWFLNGERLFLRGMRYISSQWMSEATSAMWRDDLTQMVQMEVNAIRIGSHVEKDGFYTLCDEMGLLVWQVFPLHYSVSDADDMIERASDMIRDMGQMLTNHACIGMWSVFKEPEVYLLPDAPNNYHRLCPVLKETLRTVDPVRWIHLGDYREGVYNLMIGYCWDGDTHLDEIDLPANIVEIGAGSIPVRETMEELMPAEKLWPPDWDAWEYNGFFYHLAFGFAKVEMADTLDELIERYQRYEATVVKEQVEYLRQRKYRPIASIFHYYWRDPCPIMGSGLIDYFGRRYRVYDAIEGVYGRVLVSLERDVRPYVIGREKRYEPGARFAANVWVTNDHREPIEDASISWEIVSDTGDQVAQHAVTATVSGDSVEGVDRIEWDIPSSASGRHRVEMRVRSSDGRPLTGNSTDITVG